MKNTADRSWMQVFSLLLKLRKLRKIFLQGRGLARPMKRYIFTLFCLLIWSPAAILNCRGGGGTPPATPQNFTARASSGQVTLSWDEQEGSTFNLFHSRAAGMGVEGKNLMKIVNITPPYDHTGLTDGTTYYYLLTAVNSAGASAPTDEVSATPQAQISGGHSHTCIVLDGGAKCWGWGFYGQLGNYTNSTAHTPRQVRGLTSGVTQITAGREHTCALVNGGAWCWGRGVNGRLGHNETNPAANKSRPTQVWGLTSGVTQISAGGFHTCAVVNGGAFCWGEGGNGKLGHNETGNEEADKSRPTQVWGLTSGITQISAGREHACAVVNGGAFCWGEGGNGKLGHNEPGNEEADKSRPTQVWGLTSGVTQISAGKFHTCAVVEGAAWCWGAGEQGQLGNNEMGEGVHSSIPAQVNGLTSGVTQISAGGNHTCAVVGGRALCWGVGFNGRLGHNEMPDVSAWKPRPTQVMGLTRGVEQITAAVTHTCALVNSRALCWGLGGNGELGNGGTAVRPAPVAVVGF